MSPDASVPNPVFDNDERASAPADVSEGDSNGSTSGERRQSQSSSTTPQISALPAPASGGGASPLSLPTGARGKGAVAALALPATSRRLPTIPVQFSQTPQRLGRAGGAALSFVQRRGDWLLVTFFYVLAWIIPVQWCVPFWFNPNSAASFQPLVPLGALLLAWSRRVELRHLWAELHMLYSPENSRLRGDMRWAVVGCGLLLLSYFARLPAIAFLGLILVAIGILRQGFGAIILRELSVPFVFLVLVIPPPETIISLAQQYMMYGSTKAIAVILNLVGRPILPGAITLPVEGYPMTIDPGMGGASIVTASLVLSLWLVLMVRANLMGMFAVVAAAFCGAVVLNLCRLLAMAFIGPTNPQLADALGSINPWLLASLAFAFAFGIGRTMQFGNKSK